jgi:hypothetical protein
MCGDGLGDFLGMAQVANSSARLQIRSFCDAPVPCHSSACSSSVAVPGSWVPGAGPPEGFGVHGDFCLLLG